MYRVHVLQRSERLRAGGCALRQLDVWRENRLKMSYGGMRDIDVKCADREGLYRKEEKETEGPL